MKKILVITLLAGLAILISVTGCKKENKTGLAGTYTRTQQFDADSYRVQLQFTDDGRLIWTPLDSIPGQTTSTVSYEKLENDQVRIYNDNDCGSEATYSYSFGENTLVLVVDNDDCVIRILALNGEWTRK